MSYPPNYGYPTGQQPPPGQGGYAPPPAGYAQPPGGYAPPPGGYAPPPGGYAPPPAGFAPPPGGYVPPPAGYAPQPGGYAPPPGGYAQPPGGFAPPPSDGFGPGSGACPAGYVPPPSGPCASYFYIKSLMNGLVLDIEGGVATPGRRVVTYTQKHNDADNQLWSEDSMTGTIRSKLAPNMCLTFNGSEMIVKDYQPGKQQQQLTHSGDKVHFRHNANKVLDIAEARREPMSKVIMYQANGGTNQRWVLEPAAGGLPTDPFSPGPYSAPALPPDPFSPGPYTAPAGGPHGHHGSQRWWLTENRHGAPADAVCLGRQTDGGGAYYSAVAHTQHGDIPGKAQGDTCWYPYGGREELTKQFAWICAPHGRAILVEHCRHTPRPANAVVAGKQNDGHGGGLFGMFKPNTGSNEKYGAAIAHTRHGEIPGKARDHTCWYPYGGKEETSDRFSWLTV